MFDPIWDSVKDFYFGDKNEQKWSGLCGEWSEDVYNHASDEGLSDEEGWRLDVDGRIRGPGPGYNDHVFVTVTFEDGDTFYIDNGYLGGPGRVFTDDELKDWLRRK